MGIVNWTVRDKIDFLATQLIRFFLLLCVPNLGHIWEPKLSAKLTSATNNRHLSLAFSAVGFRP